MVENDSSSSFTGIKNDLFLKSLVYYLSDDALLVASLLLLVEIIQPYCFEPEHPVEIEASMSSETEEIHNHPGEKWLGNTTMVQQT